MKNELLRLLIMVAKRTLYGFLILVVTLTTLLAYDGNAQYESIKDINVTVKLQDASLEDAINAIEAETSFNFTFRRKGTSNQKGHKYKNEE